MMQEGQYDSFFKIIQRIGGFIGHIEEVENLPKKFREVDSDEETVEFKNINEVLPGGKVILPDAVIISVGHCKRLVEFHDRKITLLKSGLIEINK